MSRAERAALQPLRIPAGWTVDYHDFREVEPSPGQELELREDLLQLTHARSGHTLDLGWYPAGNVELGEFIVQVVRTGSDWQPVHELRSRDRLSVVAAIEALLVQYG